MNDFNILFTSSGRRVSLIRHFKKTLNELNLSGKIITADIKKNAPSAFIGDVHELVPKVNDPQYVTILKEICIKYNIRLLIPLIDTELITLAKYKSDFDAIGVTLLVSSVETNEICFDKRKTAQFFEKIGVPTPKVLDPKLILLDSRKKFPLLIKPATGSSSIGVTKIFNENELKFYIEYIKDPIIQEYITGKEYTLDVLVDFMGKVRCVVPRLRMETRAGEISKGIVVKKRQLIEAGKKVVESLPGAIGCITVQCFETDDGGLKFIEINPRFGGGIPLSLEAGANFPKWIIQMMLGQNPNIVLDGYKDGIAMLRYDEAIFVHKDMIE